MSTSLRKIAAPGGLLAPTAIAAAAAAAPSLLAYNLSPSPTFLNQALALVLWAAFAIACTRAAPAAGPGGAQQGVLALSAALSLAGLGALLSWNGGWSSGLALSTLGMLFSTVVLAMAGAAARRSALAPAFFTAFAAAWVIAGLLNAAVALIQVFAPGLADGHWIASSNLPGRAMGNLRQPNHLSSLLLWAAIAAVALVELGQLPRRLAATVLAIFIFGVVLTASRTGVLGVALLVLWGLADRRLARSTRALLCSTPLMYAAAWLAMAQWAAMSSSTFGGAERLAEVGNTSTRFGIWSNTLVVLQDSPWLGVGLGRFNFAWTLSPFPGRSHEFFDHTHNLPLQLAVELGWPLASAVMALLLWALWRAARRASGAAPASTGRTTAAGAQTEAHASIGARASVLMVVMIGLHSMLEYPLWYAYFLLPTAWAWGFALGAGAAPLGEARTKASAAASGNQGPHRAGHVAAHARAAGSWPLTLGAAAVMLGTALAVWDYTRVVAIFSSGDGAPPLAQRIEAGRRSVLFSHHADYAAVTSGITMRDARASFANTTHYLLDGRLMVAWAEWLQGEGQLDHARHLAARLREFRSTDAVEFFAPCPERALPVAEAAGLPFQCQLPQRTVHWREYLRRH